MQSRESFTLATCKRIFGRSVERLTINGSRRHSKLLILCCVSNDAVAVRASRGTAGKNERRSPTFEKYPLKACLLSFGQSPATQIIKLCRFHFKESFCLPT